MPTALPETDISDDARIVHALNRLGYGPRPGDVEAVRKMGLDAWIEQQLHPETIDDVEVEGRLRSLRSLEMTTAELLVAAPPPQLLRGIGRRVGRVVGEAQIEAIFPELALMRARQERNDDERSDREMREMRRGMQGRDRVRPAVELGQAKLIRAIESERQLQEVMTDFWFNHFNVFIGKGLDRLYTTSYEQDVIRPHALGRFRELLGAVAQHPAMLFYLDNWLSAAPDADVDRRLLERYASEAIREQGLPPGGVATLILRDRGMDTSQMERQIARRDANLARGGARVRTRPADDEGPQRRGLNENYARELLELHTLGVDGGYTQQDVIEVARCFTGWTLLPLHAGGGFVFVEEMHDGGKKTVLGKKIKGGGKAEGDKVLDLLASHPRTARFISTKLARRFVSDEPPEPLVERMAETFLDSGGDIREVLRTLFGSPEFWSPGAVRVKVKTPFEFVASAARAMEARVTSLDRRAARGRAGMDEEARRSRREGSGLLLALRELGQPTYGAEPPSGYKDVATAWVSTGALLNRMKVAMGLASNRLGGVTLEPSLQLEDGQPVEAYLDELGVALMGVAPSPETRNAIAGQLDLTPDQATELGLPRQVVESAEGRSVLATGWMLSSTEFQRR